MREGIHVQVLTCRFVNLRPADWQLPPTRSGYWRFYLNDRDGALVSHAAGQTPLLARQCYLIPAGVEFTSVLTSDVGHLFVHFDLIGASHWTRPGQPRCPILVPAPDDLTDRALRLARALASPAPPAGQLLDAQAKSLLFDCLARCIGRDPQDWRPADSAAYPGASIEPALRHIDRHLGRRISNHELAKICHVSSDYLIKRFTAVTGRTPAAYLREQRLKAAERDLLTSSDSIDRIAGANGFGSRAYFTRVFTKAAGVSPAAYRRGMRQG